MSWETPESVELCARRFGVAVGDAVDVFSNSAQAWCNGYVEALKLKDATVIVAFQLPGARSGEWVKKELTMDDVGLRIAGGRSAELGMTPKSVVASLPEEDTPRRPDSSQLPRSSPASASVSTPRKPLQDTALPGNWTEEERAAYCGFLEEAAPGGLAGGDAGLLGYLEGAGLPGHVFAEVWQVANPELKEAPGPEEFWTCCRLIGHCQAKAPGGGVEATKAEASALRRGGYRLRTLLRVDWLALPPPALPAFGSQPE